jgi:rhamnose transport system permease protein
LLAAIGATLVILSGQIDISTGSQFAVASVAAGELARMGLPVPALLLLVPIAGGVLGAANGMLVARAGIPSIVVTLASMVVLRDGLRWVTRGAWVQNLPANFQWLGLGQRGGEYFILMLTAALFAACAWALRRLAAGRAIYATGSNAEAARLSGLDPKHVVVGVFVACGALTGLAAFLNAIRFSEIPSNSGIGLELKAIAAAVVGGASITGGRGSLLGTLLGVLLLGAIGTALTFLHVEAVWEKAIQGAIILAAVVSAAARLPARSAHASR